MTGWPISMPAWLAIALLSASCSGHLPTTHYYTLVEPEALHEAGGEGPIEIGVLPFAVDAPFDQDRIVYRPSERSPEIGFYEYHRWAAPLSRMLPTVVADALREMGIPGPIESVGRGAGHDYLLHGRLRTLIEIDLADGQRVVAGLDLSLRDAAGEEIWSGSTSGEERVDAESAEQIVIAMRSALRQALSRAYPSLYTRIALLLESDAVDG
jgi:uncharacterized lipoprotein YmbA